MMIKGTSKYGRERKISKNLKDDDSSQNSSQKKSIDLTMNIID